MNDRQRVVTATFVVALLVAAVYYVPWLRYETGDIHWSPFYRNPMTLESTIGASSVHNRFAYLKGRPLYSLYFLQLIGIAGVGRILFWHFRTKEP